MSNPYDKMTQEEFDEILEGITNRHGWSHIPGVYELVAEYYNNDVLAEWLANQPDEEEDDD